MLDNIKPYAISLVLFLILFEVVFSYRNKRKLYDTNETITSFVLAILGIVFRGAMKGVQLWVWFFIYSFSLFKIETSFISISILFLLHEFTYYWYHRLSHEVPFFWATHVNHHSAMKLNFSVAARNPLFNSIYLILFWIYLPLLGFHPVDVLVVQLVCFFFAFIQHTTIIPKLGFLELFLSTPSHHRVHHASNLQYVNKNYGNILIIFDRLFGTYAVESEKPVYGLTENPKNRSVINMIFHGWIDFFKGNKRIKG